MRRQRGSHIVLLAVLLAWQAASGLEAQQAPAPTSLVEAAARAKAEREKAQTPAPVITAPSSKASTAPRPSSAGQTATSTAGPQATATAPAPAAAASAKPRGAPFLWRIEGTTPAYLFGTIHVPNADVLVLPPSVESAFRASNIVYTEIPMDPATQVAALGRAMLSDERRLKDVIGQPLFERLSRAVSRSLPDEARGALGPAIIDMLNGLKPWAAMSQLSLIEFLPDMTAGRQPLDAMLYARAQQDGKQVGALETVDEQVSVFEAFTDDEQMRMLTATLDELDIAARDGRAPSQQMIARYLAGDLDALARQMNESVPGDAALSRKFTELALDRRNVVMVDRILEHRAEQPNRVCFFAVGAGHYAGDQGILALLAKKGLKVTRVSVP